jgi:hypothetical protein
VSTASVSNSTKNSTNVSHGTAATFGILCADRTEEAVRETSTYEIRVRGHLGGSWASRFEGFTVSEAADGETVLIGTDVDQAALHAMIKRVQSLGMGLVSVNETGEKE